MPLVIDDIGRMSTPVPLLADLKPGGRFMAVDMYRAGGTAVVARRLLEAGLLHGEAMTVTGRTLAEEAIAAHGFEYLLGTWRDEEIHFGLHAVVERLLSHVGGAGDVFIGGVGAGADQCRAEIQRIAFLFGFFL